MSSPAMSTKLLVVLVLLCLNLAANLYNLSGALAGTADYVRIGLNIALLVGLLRGQEWARMLAKVTAVLSLVAGGILLLQVMALGAALGASRRSGSTCTGWSRWRWCTAGSCCGA